MQTSSRLLAGSKPPPDREDMSIDRGEQTKTGEDADAAQSSEAFDRHRTSPEAEKKSDETLDVSGANQSASKPQGEEDVKKQGAGKETAKGGASGGRNPSKKGDA